MMILKTVNIKYWPTLLKE